MNRREFLKSAVIAAVAAPVIARESLNPSPLDDALGGDFSCIMESTTQEYELQSETVEFTWVNLGDFDDPDWWHFVLKEDGSVIRCEPIPGGPPFVEPLPA